MAQAPTNPRVQALVGGVTCLAVAAFIAHGELSAGLSSASLDADRLAVLGFCALLVLAGLAGLVMAVRGPRPERLPEADVAPDSRPVVPAAPARPAASAPTVSGTGTSGVLAAADLFPARAPARPGAVSILGLLLVATAGVMALTAEPEPAQLWGTVVGGLLAFALDVAWATRRIGQRAVLELLPHALRVSLPGEVKELALESFEVLSLDEHPRYRNGERIGWYRRLALRGPEGRVELENLALPGRRDELTRFLPKLVAALARVAAGRLRAGGTLQGQGWTLTDQVLRTPRAVLPVHTVALVGQAGHEMRVWVSGREAPAFRLKVASPNARVLWDVLVERIQRRPPERTEGIGFCFHEHRSPRALACAALLIGLAAFWGAGWLGLSGTPEERPLTWGLLGLGALFLAAAWAERPSVLADHLAGVVLHRWPSRPIRIADEDVVAVAYDEQVGETQGIYGGRRTTLTVTAADGQRIHFREDAYQRWVTLQPLRERLSEQVAEAMRERLAEEEAVPWAGALLTCEGLSASDGAWRVPYADLRLQWGEEGERRALKVADATGRVRLSVLESVPNFHAGLEVLRECVEEEQEGALAQGGSR